jgi:hypothetical protein
MPLTPQRLSSSPPTLQPVRADSPPLHEPGSLQFASDRAPWQRSLRWRAEPRDRRLLWLGFALAALVTVSELVGFALGMRPYRHWPASRPIEVVLIEPEVVPPVPPEPVPPIVARPSRIAIAPPVVKNTPPPPPRSGETDDAMRARIGEGGAAAAPQLFNPDGSIRIGAAAAPALAPKPASPREAAKERWAGIEKPINPLDCRKTRFADAFAPDESAGDRISRKYLKWIGMADQEAIAHRNRARAYAGGCEPAK